MVTLTNAWQQFTCRHIYHASPADVSARQHKPRVIIGNKADTGSIVPKRMASQRGQCLPGLLRRHKRDQLPLIGNRQRVKSEHFACRSHRRPYRYGCLFDLDSHMRSTGQFIQRG